MSLNVFGIMFYIIRKRMICSTGICFDFLFKLISVNFQIIKMECQVEQNEHFRHLLLFAFNRGSKFTGAKPFPALLHIDVQASFFF